MAATLIMVAVSILMPAEWIGLLRHRWWWFTYPLDRIERAHSMVNLIHATLFLFLGIAVRLALPKWRLQQVALAVLLLGVGTELVQFIVPGRHPRFSDVVVDLVAGVLGWAVIRGIRRSDASTSPRI